MLDTYCQAKAEEEQQAEVDPNKITTITFYDARTHGIKKSIDLKYDKEGNLLSFGEKGTHVHKWSKNGKVRRYDDPDWDGKYEYDRCDIYEPPLPEEGEIVFSFTDSMEVWNGFQIDGHDMKYIVEHSVNWLSH